MKFLLISYFFPPFQDPQAIRWYYLLQVLCQKGYLIDVLTIKNCLPDIFYYPSGLKIYRVSPGPLESLALRKKRALGVETERDREIRYSFKFRIFKKGYEFIKNILNFFPGDYRTEWFPFAIKYIKKNLNLLEYDFVITSHEPAVDSLIGFYLKKKYKIKWIADFGDPYITIYTPWYKKWFENKIEEKVYNLADALIFSGNKAVEILKEKYPFLKNKKIFILYQGYSLNSLNEKFFRYEISDEEINKKLELNKDFLNLFYAGTFYKEFRDPFSLFEAIKSLIKKGYKIKLYIAGRNENFLSLAKGFENFIIFLGFLPHSLILRYYNFFDLLVGITNKGNLQIPGKFFEYLGFSKPVLCITYDKKNEVVELIEKYKRGWICLNEKQDIEKVLAEIYEVWKEKKLREVFNISPVLEFSFEYQAEKFLNFINSVLYSE
ncbi:MAG: hypothetical protein NC926_07235 [Candidatus Omnitrophica bacterium]|nr:hypothetical protein [Candidatus Omnitrophota bacterium]